MQALHVSEYYTQPIYLQPIYHLLAKAMVFPHFDYCSPVWSNFTTGLHNHLQILQNKLARVLLHADIRTPIDKMMEELNWLKLDDRWKRQLLVVTFKCLKEIAPVYMSSYVTFYSFNS